MYYLDYEIICNCDIEEKLIFKKPDKAGRQNCSSNAIQNVSVIKLSCLLVKYEYVHAI